MRHLSKDNNGTFLVKFEARQAAIIFCSRPPKSAPNGHYYCICSGLLTRRLFRRNMKELKTESL
jgi:hypothetical protein